MDEFTFREIMKKKRKIFHFDLKFKRMESKTSGHLYISNYLILMYREIIIAGYCYYYF